MSAPVEAESESAAGTTIEAQGATKWYGDKVAVSDLSFALGPGVTTLVGPNGAGKTTTLKMLTGRLRPSAGTVSVLGEEVFDNPSLYRRIGIVPDRDEVYPFLSATEFVELAARLNHLPDPCRAAREALHTVGLLEDADRRVGGFSKGMRQRVKVAQALVHDPEVLFLDEPLAGADPSQRLAMIDLFAALGREGRTVLLSSHILYEAERMGSNVIVIIEGKLAAQGDFHAIRALMDDRPRRFRVHCSAPRAVAAGLVPLSGTRSVALADEGFTVETVSAPELYHAVPRLAQDAGARLYGVEGLDEDLEAVFRYLVG
jgi:ABC-2 type transport system ATP-binding protein